MHIILITELNVDGCGGFANYVAAIDHEPTLDEQAKLNQNLEAVTHEDHDCWGTDEFCQEALDRTFGEGNWTTPPCHGFEF